MNTAVPGQGDGLADKLNLLQESYAEVLDATKHQDDKVGRFLTAVSFLIAGSIALGTRTDLLGASYQLGGPGADNLILPAYLLSLFLLFIMVSLLLLVTGLGARLYKPGERPDASDSHLFFLSIAHTYERDPSDWARLWTGDSRALSEALIREYKREIPNIARRATLKYKRTLFAGAFLQFSILFLVLAAILGFLADGLQTLPGSAMQPEPVDWTALQPRLIVGIVVAVAAFILALDFRFFERFDKDSQTLMRTFLVFLAPAYALVVLTHPGPASSLWNAFGYYRVGTPFQIVIVVLAVWTAWPAFRGVAPHLLLVIAGLVFALGPGMSLLFNQIELGHLVAALLVVALLLTMRVLLRPYPRD